MKSVRSVPVHLAAVSERSSDVLPRGPSDLYCSHFAFVWRNLRRLRVSEPMLEDAAQDVFLVVHRRWHTYDSRWSSVESWLFGIVVRVAGNYRRTQRRRFSWLIPWRDDEVPAGAALESIADEFETCDAAELLDRLLDCLGEKKRVLLILVDVEEMTVPEAARILGINTNTAYFRLRAARQEFQRLVNRTLAKDIRINQGADKHGSR
jgi:RNA polymerase sigma-70 factor, ECF subfamily